MLIAVPKEIAPEENRTPLSPQTAAMFVKAGFKIQIEKGAGEAALFQDNEYASVGAEIMLDAAKACKNADIVLKVWAPNIKEIKNLRSGQTVICNAANLTDNKNLKKLADTGINIFALERIPRISKAQNMDILSSQNNLAGYAAAIHGAAMLKDSLPMMITAAGTLPPLKCLIMGIGVAGLQAIGTLKRMGAQIYATDIRQETAEQTTSLGARFIERVDPDFLASCHLIITSAMPVGKKAPMLLNNEQINALKEGTVIVDLATDAGGNVPDITRKDIAIIRNSLTSAYPHSASVMLANNVYNFVSYISAGGQLNFSSSDDIIKATLICRDKQIFIPV